MSAVLAVCGCDGNDGRESSGPRIEPALLGSLTIDADGGTDTVSYSIINPVEGGKVSASASESWISGLDCSTENAVIITSDPNPETVRRSCVITLTGDYTLDLEGTEGTAYYNGNYYGTGDNWIVQLLPGPGPDGVQIELVTSGDGVEDGIPDGTYTASTSAVPSAGEFMTGSMTDGIVFGTNYVGDFTEQGLADGFAPATAGRLDVTGHGDGTCTFEFSFLDDKGNTWDGKWTGTLSVRSSSGIKQMKLF